MRPVNGPVAAHAVRARGKALRGGREAGSFLILVVIFLVMVSAAILPTLSLVATKVGEAHASHHLIIAQNAAESGLNQTIADIKQIRDLASMGSPFQGIDGMDPNGVGGPGGYSFHYNGQPLVDSSGVTLAEFEVFVDVETVSGSQRDVHISTYAYSPTQDDVINNVPDASRAEAHVTVTVKLNDAGVFDYSYFINHWGWYYGNTIYANGSVRSNGQFDFGNYSSTINGSPRYDGSDGYKLLGYQDDNGDGVKDGSDGGVYAGMAIVNDANVKGMGALAKNQHEYEAMVSMPNIQDLSYYESKAKSDGASLKVGTTTYVSGVLGDDAGEKQSLYLVGTTASPIVLNGPVVVRGDVIIKGVVTGRGSIYAGRNIYVADNVQYKDGPTTSRPTDNSQATTEAWRQANQNKDSLGLFAKEHIVVGDFSNSSWQSNVKSWVNHSLNRSDEDAGSDGIHGTKAGLDGVLGTADDDTLEDDGVWTVSKYTSADAAAGLIPAGKSVGDVVPGSGEDIDGDGAEDGTTEMSEFNISGQTSYSNAPPWSNFAGNSIPASSAKFNTISSGAISRIDAILYTNHTLAALMAPGSSTEINMNGAVISRNESIIYSAKKLNFNHDERISGDGGGVFGFNVPQSWDPLKLSGYESTKTLPSSAYTSHSSLVSHFVGG